MKTIRLPAFGILINLQGKIDGGYRRGAVVSNLSKRTKCCSMYDCCCGNEDYDDKIERITFNSQIDGMESMVLGLALNGIDVESPAVLAAIENAVDMAESDMS